MKYKYNTRFNPSITGPLHIGHLYMALVNEAEAHSSGGEFTVRVDDMSVYFNHHLGKNLIEQYYNDYQEQLSRFMKVDIWHRQSQLPRPEEIIGEHPIFDIFPSRLPLWKIPEINWRVAGGQWVWPYSPYATLEKVVWDFWEKTSLLIRGEDLITEANFYTFIERQIGLLRPHQVYLPRLSVKIQQDLGQEHLVPGELSKTIGTYGLAKQIDKFGTKEILNLLKKSCLIDPKGEFLVENIKGNPVVEGFEE